MGYAAHDMLLWGARGMGKSALVKSVIGELQAEGLLLALVEATADQLASCRSCLNNCPYPTAVSFCLSTTSPLKATTAGRAGCGRC